MGRSDLENGKKIVDGTVVSAGIAAILGVIGYLSAADRQKAEARLQEIDRELRSVRNEMNTISSKVDGFLGDLLGVSTNHDDLRKKERDLMNERKLILQKLGRS